LPVGSDVSEQPRLLRGVDLGTAAVRLLIQRVKGEMRSS
jgi:hypothetical protein